MIKLTDEEKFSILLSNSKACERKLRTVYINAGNFKGLVFTQEGHIYELDTEQIEIFLREGE